jgi:aryl-alcohol dehydrogenase-like predicted oxidoreductase
VPADDAPLLTDAIPLSTLGASGPRVTRLGLGLAALGRPGYMTLDHARDLGADRSVAAMERHAHLVLDAAWGAGIRYFDVARSYGRGEEFLGRWLAARGISPGQIVVGSKWGYRYTADWRVDAAVHEVKEHSLAMLRQQLAESRALLGTHLDLYQIHSATLDSGALTDTGILDELARLRVEGVRIGLSVTGPAQGDTIRRALEIARDGRPLFESVQATWNLLERSAEDALAAAHGAGLGVIVKEALANGRLTSRGGSIVEPLRALAAERDASIDAMALAAVLSRPWVSVVLTGAATVEHLRSNVASLAVRWDETLERATDSMRQDPSTYWRARAALPWS